MKAIHSVAMELLRHGPPHNQLLSPLTRYLAISGRHEPVTLNVPYEHLDFMNMLKSLRYGDFDRSGGQDDETRRYRLQAMGRDIAKIFASVPGLISEIFKGNVDASNLTHLRLIISPSELSLLPYEMCRSPAGFPGEGRPLSLQLDYPLVMTREIRGASGFEMNWQREPKILFAYAEPAGMAVPAKAHLQALRNALAPWLQPGTDQHSIRQQLEKFLVVIPNATLDKIVRANEQHDFSYVHILAHGMPAKGSRSSYGLALMPAVGTREIDVVDGPRLANALRCRKNDGTLSKPLVVSLATCDSGLQSDVQWPGSSLAHTLHEEGIPLVIASQFPLSKRGSVVMTELLYEGLLWGEDPRVTLHRVRQSLSTKEQDTHDWASLVAYTSFPENFAEQLNNLKQHRASKAMLAALDRADTNLWNEEISPEQNLAELTKAMDRIPNTEPQFDLLAQELRNKRVETLTFLAGARKRMSEALGSKNQSNKTIIKLIGEATELYERAFKLQPSAAWIGIQYLLFDTYLNYRRKSVVKFDIHLWQRLEALVKEDLDDGDLENYEHGLANLLQLYFLASAPDMQSAFEKPKDWDPKEKALIYARELVDLHGSSHFVVESTYRQFRRFYRVLKMGQHMEELSQQIYRILKGI